MKHIFICLFIISFTMSVNAQGNFKKGYVISFENDTTRGWIDFRTSDINSRICTFKQTPESEAKLYHPDEIKGYRFEDEGKYYISQTIDIDGNSKVVFSEFLIQGVVNLYYYVDKQEYYLFKDQQGKITPVTRSTDESIAYDKYGTPYYSSDRGYIGTIKYLFKDSPSATQAVDKIAFTNDDIIKITKKYHNDVCAPGEKCIEFETKKDMRFTKFSWGIYTGVQYAKFDFGNVLDSSLEVLNPISNFAPVIGIELGLSVPRWLESFSLQFDLALSQISGESRTTNDLGYGQFVHKQYKYSTWLLPVKMGGRYTFLKTTLHPFVEVGVNTTFQVGASAEFTRTFENGESGIDHSPDMPTGVFLGGYASVGVSLPLKNNHSLGIRASVEANTLLDASIENSKRGHLTVSSLKVSYIF